MNTLASQSLNNSVEDSLATPGLMLTREEFESHVYRETGEEKWVTFDNGENPLHLEIFLSDEEGPKVYHHYWPAEDFIDAVTFFHAIRNMPCPLIDYMIFSDMDQLEAPVELMTYFNHSPKPEIPEKIVVYASPGVNDKKWDDFLAIAQSFQELCDKAGGRPQ